MKKRLACLGCATLLSACANEVVVEPKNGAGGAGGSGGESSAMSSSSSGGSSMECVPKDPPTNPEPTCKDLEGIVLVNPKISGDDDGDGYVEPGESATLTISMQDTSGVGFNYYPGILFESSDPKVEIPADWWFFAILPCTSQEAMPIIKVAPDAASGSTVIIRARLAMLNQQCPDAIAIDIPVPIY